jgi:hypothetical protein
MRLALAGPEPVLGAADTFDDAYTGKRVLKNGSDPACPTFLPIKMDHS